MATFRPVKKVCELDFDSKYFYTMQLNDSTLRRIIEVGTRHQQELERLNENDQGAIDKAYNISLDVLDELLGEGAGADIMSIFDDPGMIEVAQVIAYITDEYVTQYNAAFNNKENPVPYAGKRGRR